MKNQLLAAAVAAALSLGSAARAASSDELAQIRSQLQSLMQRVDKLEVENTALKAENGQLKTQTEQLAGTVASTRASQNADALKPAIPAVKAADWPNRIVIKGDTRYRYQQTDDASASSMASSRANPLYLDYAYFDWTLVGNAHLIGGKMKMPFARPGQSLFWDNDINPEGLALTYSAGSLFGSAWNYWIEENVQTGTAATTATSTDTKMHGLQVGNRFDLNGNSLVLAASYCDLAAAEGRRPFYNGASNGNSLTSTGGLADDFQVANVMAEYNASSAICRDVGDEYGFDRFMLDFNAKFCCRWRR